MGYSPCGLKESDRTGQAHMHIPHPAPTPPTPSSSVLTKVRAHGCWITGTVLSGCPPGSEIHIVSGGITEGCDIPIYGYEINVSFLNIHLILQQITNIRHLLCTRHCIFSRGYKHGKDEALMKNL